MYQMPIAKGVAAGTTLIVVEQCVVKALANGCAGRAASDTTDQSAHQGTGQASEQRANRASHHADGGARFGATKSSGGAARCTGSGPEGCSGLAAVVMGDDMPRITEGAAERRKGCGHRPH